LNGLSNVTNSGFSCSYAQSLVSPERLSTIIPDIAEWQEQSIFLANIFSGFIPALVWTGFFA
jgi:hypothetical protein